MRGQSQPLKREVFPGAPPKRSGGKRGRCETNALKGSMSRVALSGTKGTAIAAEKTSRRNGVHSQPNQTDRGQRGSKKRHPVKKNQQIITRACAARANSWRILLDWITRRKQAQTKGGGSKGGVEGKKKTRKKPGQRNLFYKRKTTT